MELHIFRKAHSHGAIFKKCWRWKFTLWRRKKNTWSMLCFKKQELARDDGTTEDKKKDASGKYDLETQHSWTSLSWKKKPWNLHVKIDFYLCQEKFPRAVTTPLPQKKKKRSALAFTKGGLFKLIDPVEFILKICSFSVLGLSKKKKKNTFCVCARPNQINTSARLCVNAGLWRWKWPIERSEWIFILHFLCNHIVFVFIKWR